MRIFQSNFFKSKLNLILILSFVAILLLFLIARFNAVFHNLPAWQFCDEYMITSHLWRLVLAKKIILEMFQYGGFNILPLLPIGFFVSEVEIIKFGKFFYLVVLGLGSVYLIYKISLLIVFKKNIAVLNSIIFMLSPYVFSVGEYWYPDHYIYFFSAGFLYFILKLYKEKNLKKLNFIFLGIISAIIVSVKWTGLILMPILFFSLLFLFLNKKEDYAIFLKNTLYLITSFLVVILLLNYSIFFNFDKFLFDFTGNIKNYSAYEKSNFNPLYYLSVVYFLFASILSPIIIIFGYMKIFKTEKFIFFLLLTTVIFYSVILGLSGNLVLHRNVSILIPFVIPLIGIGTFEFYNFFANKNYFLVNFFSKIYISFFFIILLANFLYLFLNNLQEDSRVMALKWLRSNLDNGVTIGNNEVCSGPSPAHEAGFGHNHDPMFVYNYDYYVINSYWDSKIDYLYHHRNPIITLPNQHYIHFNYFNENNIFKNALNKPNSYEDYKSVMDNYTVIKTFEGYGPKFYILMKKLNANNNAKQK